MSRVKREPGAKTAAGGTGGGGGDQAVTERREIRSRYLAVKNLISDDKEDAAGLGWDKFSTIITQVESLHEQVQKPREQVADAEALLDLTNNLVTSVKSFSKDGVTPTTFVNALLRNFSQQNRGQNAENAPVVVNWANVGHAVSHVFKLAVGSCTMLGPMDIEVKQRKTVVRRKRTRPTESDHPEELNSQEEHKTDTDKNMSTMFDILRKNKSVRLENLVVNKLSFAQTIENLFALSFLVKDGRAEITLNDSRHHIVSPRNAPSATAIASGDASYSHFVFRFDFKDWQLMSEVVGVGEELMPHRKSLNMSGSSQPEQINVVSQAAAPTTPIRKLSRNRGLVIQDQGVVEDSPERESTGSCILPRQKRKRRIFD